MGCRTAVFKISGYLLLLNCWILDPVWAQSMPGVAASENLVAVIAHPSVPTESVNQQMLLDFYTLEKNKWEDGTLVVLFEQKQETASKKQFYAYLEKRPRELKKVWMRVVLSGEGRTPRTVRSEEEVIQEVAATPGAIGYAAASLVTEQVVVLGYIPGEPSMSQN